MSLEQDLIKQLEASPEAEILGVVGAGGVGASGIGPSADSLQWTILFKLSGWRPYRGELRKSELFVRKLVPEAALQNLIGEMSSYDVVRIRARWSENNVFDSPQALLTEFIGQDDSDSELNSLAVELQKPVTFADPQLGSFTFDRGTDWYESTPCWCGCSIRLKIPAGTANVMEQSLSVARQLWSEQEHWQLKNTSHAAKSLLKLKNDNWLRNDESKVSEGEFARRMVLESISVEADGSFEFWYEDGDLFAGHFIKVIGSLKNGPTDAGIC